MAPNRQRKIFLLVCVHMILNLRSYDVMVLISTRSEMSNRVEKSELNSARFERKQGFWLRV